MDGNIVAQLFPGIASLMVQDTTIAIARIALIAFGFILAYLGFKRIPRAVDYGADGYWHDLY